MTTNLSTSNTRVFSAPGKVILSGEHAVVYGKVAVASTINLRTWCAVTVPDNTTNDNSINNAPTVTFNLPIADTKFGTRSWKIKEIESVYNEYDDHKFINNDEEVAFFISKLVDLPSQLSPSRGQKLVLPYIIFHFTMVRVVRLGEQRLKQNQDNTSSPSKRVNSKLDIKKVKIPTMSFSVHTELPIQAGLGSSASFCVVLAKALLVMLCIEHTNDDINRIAFEAESVIHGKSSGVDNVLCCYGGSLKYEAGHMESLTIPNIEVMILNTRIERSTKDVVADVRILRDRYPDVIDPVMTAISNIGNDYYSVARKYTDLVKEEDALGMKSKDTLLERIRTIKEKQLDLQRTFALSLSDLFQINQNLLQSIGVSNVDIDSKIIHLRQMGLAVKIAGAGRGGCLVAVYDERGNKIKTPESTNIHRKNKVATHLNVAINHGILSPIEGFMPTFVLDSATTEKNGDSNKKRRINSAKDKNILPSVNSDIQQDGNKSKSRLDADDTSKFNGTAELLHHREQRLQENILNEKDIIDKKSLSKGSIIEREVPQDELDEFVGRHFVEGDISLLMESVHNDDQTEGNSSKQKNSSTLSVANGRRVRELLEIQNALCKDNIFDEGDIWIATLGCEGVREDTVESFLAIATERFRYGNFV